MIKEIRDVPTYINEVLIWFIKAINELFFFFVIDVRNTRKRKLMKHTTTGTFYFTIFKRITLQVGLLSRDWALFEYTDSS